MPTPKKDEKLIKRLIKKLRWGRTAKELELGLGIPTRTLYRYLKELRDRGHNVIRVGMTRPVVYKILK